MEELTTRRLEFRRKSISLRETQFVENMTNKGNCYLVRLPGTLEAHCILERTNETQYKNLHTFGEHNGLWGVSFKEIDWRPKLDLTQFSMNEIPAGAYYFHNWVWMGTSALVKFDFPFIQMCSCKNHIFNPGGNYTMHEDQNPWIEPINFFRCGNLACPYMCCENCLKDRFIVPNYLESKKCNPHNDWVCDEECVSNVPIRDMKAMHRYYSHNERRITLQFLGVSDPYYPFYPTSLSLVEAGGAFYVAKLDINPLEENDGSVCYSRPEVMILKQHSTQKTPRSILRAQFHKIWNRFDAPQRSETWFQMRTHVITATDAVAILGYSKYLTADEILTKKAVEQGRSGDKIGSGPATDWGNAHEDVAIALFAVQHKKLVYPCGLYVSYELPIFGASPDGITSEGELIEVKCPYRIQYMKSDHWPKKYPEGALCCENDNVDVSIEYYTQVQLQMFVTQTQSCYLVIYYGAHYYNGKPSRMLERCCSKSYIRVHKIAKDHKFLITVIPKLLQFYQDNIKWFPVYNLSDSFSSTTIYNNDGHLLGHTKDWLEINDNRYQDDSITSLYN